MTQQTQHEGYKANLLQRCKYVAGRLGGKVTVSGWGNEARVMLEAMSGRSCVVW